MDLSLLLTRVRLAPDSPVRLRSARLGARCSTWLPSVRRLAAKLLGSRRMILTFSDQALVSLTSFATGVIVGRVCTREEFGLYALAFMVFYHVAELQSNLLLVPYTVFHPRLTPAEAREYRGVVLSLQFAGALACLAVLVAVGLVLPQVHGASTSFAHVLYALGASGAFLLTRDGVRRLCFAWLRPAHAWVLDAIVGVIQLTALIILAATHHLSAVTAFVTIGAVSGLVASGWLLWQRNEFTIVRQGWSAKARSLWSLGRWMSANSLTSSATGQAYSWLITAMAGASALAVVAASASVATIVNPAIFALLNFLGPSAAHALAQGGLGRLRRLVVLSSVLFLLAATPVCIVALLFGERLVTLAYGAAYAHSGTVVALTAMQLIPTGLSAITSRGLVVLERADLDLKVNLLPLLTIILALRVIPLYGAVGAVSCWLAGNALAAVARCVVFARVSALGVRRSSVAA